MALLNTGGVRWDPYLVAWGKPGRPAAGRAPSKELLGYYPKKPQQGAMGLKARAERTVDFWKVTAVYALFERDRVVYVGEGSLGSRLLQHWKKDDLAGRWDSFTWLSPHGYDHTPEDHARLVDPTTTHEVSPAALVELLELIAIRLGTVGSNRQLPSLGKQVKWMTQVRSENAQLSLDQKIDLLLNAMEAE